MKYFFLNLAPKVTLQKGPEVSLIWFFLNFRKSLDFLNLWEIDDNFLLLRNELSVFYFGGV